jgi:hypothetical protein
MQVRPVALAADPLEKQTSPHRQGFFVLNHLTRISVQSLDEDRYAASDA